MLKIDADNQDIFLAFLYAFKIKYMLAQQSNLTDFDNQESLFLLKETCLQYINNLDLKMIIEQMKNYGWIFDLSALEAKYLRYHMVFKNI